MEPYSSCSLGTRTYPAIWYGQTPAVWRKHTLLGCRAATGGTRRDMEKFIARTQHRRARNMKRFKLSKQQILKEIEENETEDTLQQKRQFDTGDDSFTDQYLAISKPWFSLPLSDSEDYVKEKTPMQSNLSVQIEESQPLGTPMNGISSDVSATTETIESNVAYSELKEL